MDSTRLLLGEALGELILYVFTCKFLQCENRTQSEINLQSGDDRWPHGNPIPMPNALCGSFCLRRGAPG